VACREAAEGLEAVEGVEAVEVAEAATLASIITGLLIVFTASATPPGGKQFKQCTQRSLHLSCKSLLNLKGLGHETELKHFDKNIIYLGLKMKETLR
jgi:hypothetical protein